MAESDGKEALQERRRVLLEKAESAVPKVEDLDGLPNLVQRRVFKIPVLGIPADLKALVLGSLFGAAAFFVLFIGIEAPWWIGLIAFIGVAIKVNNDFTQGDGVELKAMKPQRKQSKQIGDVVRMGPDTPDDFRLLVVHRGREVGYLDWLRIQEEVEARMAKKKGA